MFSGRSIMVWGCFSYDHKLDLVVVKQTLTGQCYTDDILQPIVYPHYRAHQAAHPVFQDDNARPHRARVVTESLAQEAVAQQESRYESHQALWHRIGRNVNKRNNIVTLDDLARAPVDEWNNLEPQCLRKLVQGMPRRVRQLRQRRGGYTRY